MRCVCFSRTFLPNIVRMSGKMITFAAYKQNSGTIMEFKIRANVILSKDLTIEADNMAVAFDKAQELINEGVRFKELTFRDVKFELLSHAIGDNGLVEIKEKEVNKD